MGAIVGGVFAGLFLIMAVVYYLLKKRKRVKRPTPEFEDEEHTLESELPIAMIEEGNVSARLGKEYSHVGNEGKAPIENGTGKDIEEGESAVLGGRLRD